jgi:hypothetical protein
MSTNERINRKNTPKVSDNGEQTNYGERLAAGIAIDGKDKWITLIQNASRTHNHKL